MPAIPHMTVRSVGRSARADAGDDDGEGAKHDHEIQPERTMLQVVEIVFEFQSHRIAFMGVALVDLRPSGHAWAHDAAQGKVRDLTDIFLVELERLRTRAHPAH